MQSLIETAFSTAPCNYRPIKLCMELYLCRY